MASEEDDVSFPYIYGLIALLPSQQGGSIRYAETVKAAKEECAKIGVFPESGMDLLDLMKEVREAERRFND